MKLYLTLIASSNGFEKLDDGLPKYSSLAQIVLQNICLEQDQRSI